MTLTAFFSPLISLLRSTGMALSLLCLLTGLAYAEGQAASPQVMPVRLIIPKIDLDSSIVAVWTKPVVVEGKTYQIWETADNEVGWNNLSALPGQQGNTVLTGHSDIKAQIFR